MTQDNTAPVMGIIGDGQLALMLAESLTSKGLNFCALSTSEHSPMMRNYRQNTTMDRNYFRQLCSVFTLENEFLSPLELSELLEEKTGFLFPDLQSYSFFGDKLSQRKLYEQLGLPSPKWRALSSFEEMSVISQQFNYPFVLKAAQGGYDGKGVRIIHSDEDFTKAVNDFGLPQGQALLVEEKVSIKMEVAQGFLRRQDGVHTFLPLVETVQQEGVCNFVHYPCPVSESIRQQVEGVLKKLIDFPLNGIFNFEFFITHDDQVFINEGAPRPHNSQHITIDAGSASQFDLLADYLSGSSNLPKSIEMYPSAMVNVLGRSTGEEYSLHLPQIQENVEIYPKLYGKQKCTMGRKMGHVNIVDRSGEIDLRPIAEKIFKEYRT